MQNEVRSYNSLFFFPDSVLALEELFPNSQGKGRSFVLGLCSMCRRSPDENARSDLSTADKTGFLGQIRAQDCSRARCTREPEAGGPGGKEPKADVKPTRPPWLATWARGRAGPQSCASETTRSWPRGLSSPRRPGRSPARPTLLSSPPAGSFRLAPLLRLV